MTTETKPYTAELGSDTHQEWESANAVEIAIDLAERELEVEPSQGNCETTDTAESQLSAATSPDPGRGLLGKLQGQSLLDSTKPMLLLISALCIGLFISSLLLAL